MMTRAAPPPLLLLFFLLACLLAAATGFRFRAPLPRRTIYASSTTASGSDSSSSSSSKPKPLLSIPIPGSATATLQIPAPEELSALAADSLAEARTVGLRGVFERTLKAQQAAVEVATEAAGDGALLEILRDLFNSNNGSSNAPRLLRKLFEKLGCTYVKLGQFIASSPTLFPEAFVTEFQQCLDDVSEATLPFDEVSAIVEAELGAPLSTMFESFDPKPLASASIAQVHGAVLREKFAITDGEQHGAGAGAPTRRVVVKVRKPGVEETLRTDLAFLNVATAAVEAVAPEVSRISLADTARDLRDSMLGELDFRSEARNLRTFGAFLDANPQLRAQATCPVPVAALTSERVLTMTRLNGKPLMDALESDSSGGGGGGGGGGAGAASSSSEAAVVAALDTWCQSVVSCEFFHADVHGGNVLILEDGRVGFIDFGIVGTLPEGSWGAVNAMRAAVATNDFKGVANSLVQLGVVPSKNQGGGAGLGGAVDKGEGVDVDALAKDLEGIFRGLERATTMQGPEGEEGGGGGGGGSDQQAPEVMQDVAEVAQLTLDVVATAERNGLCLPREFGLLVKQGLYFDRYLKTLAPDLNPFKDPRVSALGGGGGGEAEAAAMAAEMEAAAAAAAAAATVVEAEAEVPMAEAEEEEEVEAPVAEAEPEEVPVVEVESTAAPLVETESEAETAAQEPEATTATPKTPKKKNAKKPSQGKNAKKNKKKKKNDAEK